MAKDARAETPSKRPNNRVFVYICWRLDSNENDSKVELLKRMLDVVFLCIILYTISNRWLYGRIRINQRFKSVK